MSQNEEENKKLNDILKKHYFSFDIHSMLDNESFKNMVWSDNFDKTFLKELLNLTDAIFASWGEDPLPSTDAIIFIGKNTYGEPIYKSKHFAVDKLYLQYLNHIRSHAAHTLQQPSYYKRMFEILN